MKSIKNLKILRKLFLIIALTLFYIQDISSMQIKKSLIEALDESFLEENFEKEELEYAVPMTNSTSKAEMSAEGWLKISSNEFKNIVKFPAIEINGKKFYIKTDNENFRINTMFDSEKKGDEFPKSNLDFYFRLVKNFIYYTISKNDINILASIDIVSVNEKSLFLPGQEIDGLCFSILDQENNNWDLCANDKKTSDTFLCNIRKSLGISCNEKILNSPNNNTTTSNSNKTSIETEIYQPIIVIPIPAKECNSNWDYTLKGNDWECGCKEGAEQSPIDIPEISNVFESSATPIFTFNHIAAKSAVTSIDGELKTNENIKIKYFKNAIRILHNDIGKIVTLDGSVYIGEEIVFHTPAEHKLNGKKMDMEMQIIYYGRSKGDIAKQVILSFLFEQRSGVYNKFLEDLDIFNLPNEVNPVRNIQNDLFIPKIFYNSEDEFEINTKPFSFYTYQGSLTMPPCSEGTIHYVVSKPLQIGSVVIQLFREALKKENLLENGVILDNNRKTQPLNGRKVFYYDQEKYNVDLNVSIEKSPVPKVSGHYERIKQSRKMYQWINDSNVSNFPGATVVPELEVERILKFRKN
jgi:carbonic anhydrase